MTRAPRRALLLLAAVVVLPAGAAAVSGASPPAGVTPTVVARGTYPEFKVQSDKSGPVDFRAVGKSPLDMVVRRHEYAPGAYTGWHSHPGPVFITVTKGSLTFYEYDGGACRKVTLTATADVQPGYVDSGHGHFVRNESGAPAEDVSVIVAPTEKGAFRGELDVPEGCGF